MAKGRKTGGGSRAGKPNKATHEIKDIARSYAPAAMKELARLSVEAESEQARVAAIKEILDRAYGKASQPLSNDPDNPLPTFDNSELARAMAFILTKQGKEG